MKDSERNQKGKEFEASGDIDSAIEIYEQNVTILSPAPFPYKRLALIYKKKKDIDNEIRVLKALLSIQENEAKKYKWVEGTKPFEKIIEIREKLQSALGRKKV
jgi:tetratricopeptide (TPR) repeat protein